MFHLLLALQLTALQPAPPVNDFQFVTLPGRNKVAMTVLERMVTSRFPNARPASLNRGPLDQCDARSLPTHVNRCVRALLPPSPAGDAALMAFAIEDIATSNVTGSVVHRRHTISCIGSRGVGRAELRTQLNAAESQAAQELLAPCVAEALGHSDEWGRSEERNGVRIWQVQVDAAQLAQDAGQARGWAPESAIVEILAAVTTHRVTGRCSLRARIVYVESGERLRADDEIELSAPCRWEGADPISRMFTQGGLYAGPSARVYLGYRDGILLYLEAL
jgi:hypothetical protein